MGRKNSQTVMKSRQFAIDKKQMNLRKWADKNTNDCTESVRKGLSKATSDIP